MIPNGDGKEKIVGIFSTLLDRASQRCDMMVRMLSNPELGNTAPIISTGLEFTMKAIGIAAREVLESEHPVSDDLKPLATTFLQKHDVFLACTLNANYHKNDKEMGKGWTCSGCGNAVPEQPIIEGLRRGPVRVFLSCKACEQRTELTKEGYAVFQDLFGTHLHAPRWNPRGNDFKWDGS